MSLSTYQFDSDFLYNEEMSWEIESLLGIGRPELTSELSINVFEVDSTASQRSEVKMFCSSIIHSCYEAKWRAKKKGRKRM